MATTSVTVGGGLGGRDGGGIGEFSVSAVHRKINDVFLASAVEM